jgi:hypothetical protein
MDNRKPKKDLASSIKRKALPAGMRVKTHIKAGHHQQQTHGHRPT